MIQEFSALRKTIPHLLPLSLIVLFWLIAWSAFSQEGKGRDWWWFKSNDSCQGFAAQSASMRLGAPIQTVVWPGATLSIPYLYATAFAYTPTLPMSVENAEALLNQSVQFHWAQAGIYGLALLLLIYLLGVRWTGSPTLAFMASGLLASNTWFLWGLFHVRAEIPSLVFALASCFWAITDRPKARPIARTIVFGGLLTLAILSKIQIAPVVLLSIYLFANASRVSTCPTSSRWWGPSQWFAVVLSIFGVGCMVRTSAIDNATYGLGGLPSTFANFMITLTVIALITAVLLARCTCSRLKTIGAMIVLLSGGAVLGIIVLLLPIAYHGGLSAALTSANRIAYGTTSFARYGLQLDAWGGWGRTGSLSERVASFLEFQASSGLISGSLVLWAGIIVVVSVFVSTNLPLASFKKYASLFHNLEKNSEVVKAWRLPILLFSTGVLCDIVTTHRTVSTTSYHFYHIYSNVFYLLAAAVGIGNVGKTCQLQKLTATHFLACLSIIQFLAATILAQKILKSDRVKIWKEQILPDDYFGQKNSIKVVFIVAPEFGTLTGQSYDALSNYILQQKNR